MVWTESRRKADGGRFRWKFSALGRRVVLVMLLAAHFFAALATSVQVLAEHRQYQKRKTATLEYVSVDLVPQLADDVSPTQLQDLVLAIPGIASVDLLNSDPSPDVQADARIPVPGGMMIIELTPHHLRSSALDLFAANLLRTVITGMIMLIIFDRIAARHLRQIARQVRSIHWMDKDSPIKLERDAGIFPDEIGSIVNALESMRRQSLTAYESLSSQAGELRQLNKSMRTVNREQAELTYALSHDLIAPVNTLDMLLAEIAEDPAARTKDALDPINDMRISITRMRAQIEAVQIYARLLQDDIENVDVNLDDLVADVLKELEDEIELADARIERGELGHVIGHPASFRQVFVELLRNALRYRDTQRPLLIGIKTVGDASSTTTQIHISDTGLGIDPLYRDAVFGLFRRLHTYSDIPGNGMGLPLSRRVMNRHRGKLSLTSTPGVGTTVKLTFARTQP